MFASIRRYRLIDGSMEELVRRVDDGFAERLRAQPGFVSYELIEAGEDMVVTVSLFATEEMAELSRELAEEWTESALDDMRFARMSALHCRVMVSRADQEMLRATHATAGKVASMRRYRLRSGDLGELMHIVDEVFAEQLAGAEGIHAYHVMDCGEGAIISLTLCDDRAAAERSDALAKAFVSEHLAGFDIARTDALTGDVVVSRAVERLLEPAHA